MEKLVCLIFVLNRHFEHMYNTFFMDYTEDEQTEWTTSKYLFVAMLHEHLKNL